MKSLGICLGASNIKLAEIIQEGNEITVGKKCIQNHESNPRKVFTDFIADLDLETYDFGVLTGRKFRDMVNAFSITEPEAVEYALKYINRNTSESQSYNAVASLGAENFIIYLLNNEGNIATVETGNKCASGTGEFFLQQIGRMNISTEEAVQLAKDSEVYRVSGRCSVFCKSDCTHALNRGLPIGRVTAGLCEMMSEKILDLLEKVEKKNIIAIGGVSSNTVVMDFLRNNVDSLFIPEDADVFEALGAAYFALQEQVKLNLDPDNIFKKEGTSFSYLPPISKGQSLVEFKEMKEGKARKDDTCIVGLDVGSTTTKAVILRTEDNAILASVYLRTNGNPVKASRECYRELDRQIKPEIDIIGLGVTGSGRQIAGLHASSDSIINEIIAHATGAAYFDKDVDTIFEIGGQDAKYTFLTNAVPSDYAMNEACSAGTGSFLEESASESLGIGYKEIETIAMQGKNPPNFNDQCAAFISSDIKTATHEGIGKEDIVAGLVYSIGMNYVNRVKGQRTVGNRIFMQGGVCYNKAVPLAMANLMERKIIIPPEPGLIGAFGVALELKNRIEHSLAQKHEFNLRELAQREISYGKSFKCKGGTEKCDRGCEINMMIIEGKKFPFGGACNRYYNLVHHITFDTTQLDFVQVRQNKAFEDYGREQHDSERKKIGISRSYLTNTFFPLFYHFFNSLGLDVVLSDEVDPGGIKRKRSSFCYPGEIAHGCFANLLSKDLDYIFIPKIMGLHVEKSVNPAKQHQSTCVLLQSEAYYLKSAFKSVPTDAEMITPLLDFSPGYKSQERIFVDIAGKMGFKRKAAVAAFRFALAKQHDFLKEIKETGRSILDELERDPEKSAVILFGRPYNAFAGEANMGIPGKFASRGILIIPWDFLPFEDEYCDRDMCWAIGQDLLKAVAFVKKHPQLFGAWITNFSCGPDSFMLGYFRDIMKTKPSLTLELDSHTADTGVNTRIEAFLDIVQRYREIGKKDQQAEPFTPAQITFEKGIPYFITSDNEKVSFLNNRVHLLIPSMGRFLTESVAAAFRGLGVQTSALPVYDFEALKLGRANASCKECLPLLLTAGGLLKHIKNRENNDELLAYFMVYTPGNCRFPQYRVFLQNMVTKNRMKNVALFSLTAEKGYLHHAFTGKDRLKFVKAFIVSDVMEDIKNTLSVLAVDTRTALNAFETEWNRIIHNFESGKVEHLYKTLEEVAANLRSIRLRYPLTEAKKVSLMGEIFVRRDYFSCQDLLQRLSKRDIVVKKAHFFEWSKYVDYIIRYGIYQPDFDLRGRLQFYVKQFLQKGYERKIKSILAQSGLYEFELVNIEEILAYGKNFFDIEFRGESILVTGDFFRDILHTTHGVISIGPFACMPTRVIESVLSAESTVETKLALDRNNGHRAKQLKSSVTLPFLSIESDGNPFPQIVEARIEAFCLQVERLHRAVSKTS